MRRIVMFNQVAVDGYFADTDGKLDWVVSDEEVHRNAVAGMPDVDTILFGRRTYEMFASFWPHALDDSPDAPDPHGGGRRSPSMRAMATWLNETPKVVFSTTLKAAAWKNSRVVPQIDPREIDKMKRQPGADLIIFGSGSVVTELTRHGLVDEYQFVVSPILLGRGRSMWNDLTKSMKLQLLEAKSYQSGVVMLRYAPGR